MIAKFKTRQNKVGSFSNIRSDEPKWLQSARAAYGGVGRGGRLPVKEILIKKITSNPRADPGFYQGGALTKRRMFAIVVLYYIVSVNEVMKFYKFY